jgi:hypothetical protein
MEFEIEIDFFLISNLTMDFFCLYKLLKQNNK